MPQRNEIGDIFLGIFLVFAMHTSVFIIFWFISSLLLIIHIDAQITFLRIGFLGIGIIQLMYVIPAVIWAISRDKWGVMKGLITGAAITALLNAYDWLLVLQALL